MERQLYWACEDGKVEEVIKLLQNEQININWQNQNYYLKTPFYIACEKGHIEVVKLLVNNNRIDINKADENGETPFLIACYHEKTGVVKYLLECGREIDYLQLFCFSPRAFYL